MKVLRWAWVALALGACGPVVVTPGDTIYDDGDQGIGATGCPFNPSAGGVGAPGDPCTNAAADCAPTCCECASPDSYWASECSGGVCTDSTTACTDAFNSDASLCPAG
ncbi:MAG: hypothetical protein ACYDCL_19370 [Myxococcales bacterium]